MSWLSKKRLKEIQTLNKFKRTQKFQNQEDLNNFMLLFNKQLDELYNKFSKSCTDLENSSSFYGIKLKSKRKKDN
jgi:hypothetical protein